MTKDIKTFEINDLIEFSEEDRTLTIRDQLLISQALHTAIAVMEVTENPHKSNLADMKALMEDKFPLWAAVEEAKSKCDELLNHENSPAE